ncbi:hypothetical protein [Ferrithrix thermotolerans]|uniref:hypothetical protein n=1 Tax=Ferrithrix thermotolerans TaxID=209649 RepID=UPI0015B95F57|nr:hypothetical protein [Ferrithrix thermotolerans]
MRVREFGTIVVPSGESGFMERSVATTRRSGAPEGDPVFRARLEVGASPDGVAHGQPWSRTTLGGSRDSCLPHPFGKTSEEVAPIPKKSQKLLGGCQIPRPCSRTVRRTKAQFSRQIWRTGWEPVGGSERGV